MGKKLAKTARELLANFEEDMTVYGVCSIGKFMTEILLILRMGVYRKPGVWGRF